MFRVSAIAALLVCSPLVAQDSRNMILAASRSGVVELIDPSTLETVGRIHSISGLRPLGSTEYLPAPMVPCSTLRGLFRTNPMAVVLFTQ